MRDAGLGGQAAESDTDAHAVTNTYAIAITHAITIADTNAITINITSGGRDLELRG